MKVSKKSIEAAADLPVRAFAAIAIIAASVTLYVHAVRNIRTELEVANARREIARLELDNTELDARLHRKDAEVHKVVETIQKAEQEQKKQKIEMSEVLARASALKGEKDHFDSVHAEVLRLFGQMDRQYLRASEHVAGIQAR